MRKQATFALAACGVFAPGVFATIVLNGSFESPDINTNIDDGHGLYWYRRVGANTLHSWSHPGNASVMGHRPGGWEAFDGDQYAEVESGFGAFLAQSVPTTPGRRYRLTFAHAPDPLVAAGDADVRVRWEGNQVGIASATDVTTADLNWQVWQFDVIATGTSAELRFEDALAGVPHGGGFIDAVSVVALCGPQDFDGDGDSGTDADIEAFFACLAGNCCATCFSGGADFNGDGDLGTDADIESFFRVLGGGAC